METERFLSPRPILTAMTEPVERRRGNHQGIPQSGKGYWNFYAVRTASVRIMEENRAEHFRALHPGSEEGYFVQKRFFSLLSAGSVNSATSICIHQKSSHFKRNAGEERL